jgi:hypothetical protein
MPLLLPLLPLLLLLLLLLLLPLLPLLPLLLLPLRLLPLRRGSRSGSSPPELPAAQRKALSMRRSQQLTWRAAPW